MRHAILAVVGLPLSLLAFAWAARAQSFDIIQVGDGVYAAIGRPGVFSNGAFMVNKDDVLVVDTHLRPSWARNLIAEIRKITDKPVRYAVDTHWHPDHVQGNQAYLSAFGPRVEYLAQHNTREDMVSKAVPNIQEQLTKEVPEAIERLEKALREGKDSQGKPLTAESRGQVERQLDGQKSYLEELQRSRSLCRRSRSSAA
jgi:cyclase